VTAGDSVDLAAVRQAAGAALAKGEASQARDLLTSAIASGSADASIWLAMAEARALLGDDAGKGEAIDQALAVEPKSLPALLAKADHLAAAGDERAAAAFYRTALQHASRYDRLPAPLQAGLRRAKAATERMVRHLEEFVRAELEARGLGASAAPPRFANAVDILFGKKRAYAQAPRYLFFPELAPIQFHERAAFPWLDAVEAAFADIRDELEGVIGPAFSPYLTQSSDRPKSAQMGLVDNPDWGAFFLYKDGAEQPGAAQCPRTLSALKDAPLTRIPARTPSILFSKLAAGAHIPAHTGMLNTRLIVHLPLIVPEGCVFRVGNDVREWREGEAWVFDDTIEHEAWNRSGRDRYILLFDVWRPELSEAERAGVAALCQAIDAYQGASAWDA
jgi:aspartyl/asparaginyl beta-hydroxylase (cupin superfamily)